jgi:hypothetical protein
MFDAGLNICFSDNVFLELQKTSTNIISIFFIDEQLKNIEHLAILQHIFAGNF